MSYHILLVCAWCFCCYWSCDDSLLPVYITCWFLFTNRGSSFGCFFLCFLVFVGLRKHSTCQEMCLWRGKHFSEIAAIVLIRMINLMRQMRHFKSWSLLYQLVLSWLHQQLHVTYPSCVIGAVCSNVCPWHLYKHIHSLVHVSLQTSVGWWVLLSTKNWSPLTGISDVFVLESVCTVCMFGL